MFEKEAEEYVNEEYDLCYYPEDNLSTRINARRDWQKGAEFGYNKANEWHYVKDGDLPEVDNRIVLCVCVDGYIDEKKHYILKLLTRKEFPLFQPVYAWKEIVLPEQEG